ncbi:hypothetical protein ACFQ3W_08530 [Paenibacillus puldeungensis]|uniref:Uncharacterized protein n=1 Tax=Paenibacillus puldeungensis TaxID=696536 RepID=A0ABW3RX91_9BACL
MKHKLMIQVFILTLLCAPVMASLSWFGEKIGKPAHVSAVFAGGKPPELTSDNLVDGLQALDLPVPIARVDLSRGILSVDLKVTEDNFDAELIYEGMAEMISFAFDRTSNVDQLLLRLLAEDRWLGTKYLLLAADIRRDEWPAEAMSQLRSVGNVELPDTLRQRLRVTETHLWKKQFNQE